MIDHGLRNLHAPLVLWLASVVAVLLVGLWLWWTDE